MVGGCGIVLTRDRRRRQRIRQHLRWWQQRILTINNWIRRLQVYTGACLARKGSGGEETTTWKGKGKERGAESDLVSSEGQASESQSESQTPAKHTHMIPVNLQHCIAPRGCGFPLVEAACLITQLPRCFPPPPAVSRGLVTLLEGGIIVLRRTTSPSTRPFHRHRRRQHRPSNLPC